MNSLGKPESQSRQTSSHPSQVSCIRNAAVGNYNCSPNTGNPQLDKTQPPRGGQHNRTWVATHSRNSSTERHRGWPQAHCKKKLQWGAAVEGSEQFCQLGWCRVGRDTPSPSRAPSVAEWGFLVAPTLVLRPLHLHLMFGGGQVPLIMPNCEFRRPNVHRTPVIPHARHGNCCQTQGQTLSLIHI